MNFPPFFSFRFAPFQTFFFRAPMGFHRRRDFVERPHRLKQFRSSKVRIAKSTLTQQRFEIMRDRIAGGDPVEVTENRGELC